MARKSGSYQKRTFLDTDLGRFIYLVEPILFQIICPANKVGYAPDINLVLKLCDCSNNESFKTNRFQSYVDGYILYGLRVKRRKKITKEIIDYYEKIRSRRLMKKGK
mgnify:CR=1 FL=1